MPVRALEHLATDLQTVERCGDYSQTRYHGKADIHAISAEQHEKLAYEIAETRQAHRAHDKEETRAAQGRHARPQAAHSRDLPRVHAFLKSAGDYEQCPRADAVAHHLNKRARKSDGVTGENPNKHKPHVADTGLGDQTLQITLRDREKRTVEDADYAKRHHGRSKLTHRPRKEREHEPN